MSDRYPGGIIIANPTAPTTTSAPGIWTLEQASYYIGQGTWPLQPPPPDTYFDYVTLLLNGDGTNGAQNNTFLDSSSNAFSITRNGNTTQGSFSPYGSLWSNLFIPNGSNYLTTGYTGLSGSGDYTVSFWIYLNSWTGGDSNGSDGGFVYIYNQGASHPTYPFAINISKAGKVCITDSANFGASWYSTFNSAGSYNTANSITTGTWNYIHIVRQSGTLSIYANGGLQFSTSESNALANPLANGTLNPSNGFDGYISNFRITNTAIASATPPTTPLTAVTGTALLTCQSNRFIDNSSNNYSITPTGTIKVQRFSPFNPTASYSTATIGGSGYFDGTGDYLQSADGSAFALGTGDFTLECWVYPLSLSAGYKYVFNNLSPSGSGNTEWAIAIATATPVFESYNTGYLSSSTNLNLNTWNHIAVSRSGSTLSMFLNGVRTATASNSNNFSASNGARVGAYGNGSSYYTGYVTDARAVKGTAVYSPSSSTITIPTAPLTAISNTSILCNMTNAGIPDYAMMNDLETVGNAQVSTSVKKFGTGSLYFDGTGDYLKQPNNQALNFNTGDFTVEGWINPSGFGTQNFIVSQFTAAGEAGWLLRYSSSSLVFYANSGAIAMNNSTTFNTGTWYHVAVSRSGSSIKMFVNGTQIGSTVTSSENLTSTNSAYVGGHPDIATDTNGYIDDLRITKGYARYTSNFTAPTTAFPTY